MGKQATSILLNKIRLRLHWLNLKIKYKIYPKPRKVIFDHLPKCGGSSLNSYLLKQYLSEDVFSIDGITPDISINNFKAQTLEQRHKYNLVKGHYANNLFDFVDSDCIKITVLREPIERIVSHYYYAKRRSDHYLHSTIVKNNMSLEEYATSGLSKELINWYTSHFSGLPENKISKNAIPVAIRNIIDNYDLIGFLDNYQSFISKLENLACFRMPHKDIKLNVTRNRTPFSRIPQKTRDIIAQVNHLDVHFYNELKKELNN